MYVVRYGMTMWKSLRRTPGGNNAYIPIMEFIYRFLSMRLDSTQIYEWATLSNNYNSGNMKKVFIWDCITENYDFILLLCENVRCTEIDS